MGWIALCVAILANVLANVSLKLALEKAGHAAGGVSILTFLQQPWAWAGVFAAAVLLASYLVAIRYVGLGVSYATVTSVALVLITVLASMVFGETLTLASIAGVTLIVAGVALVVLA